MDIPAAELHPLRDLYARGRYAQALAAGAAKYGPVRAWAGTPARLLAGRLAMQLGAPKLGRRLHAAAFRHSPAYPEAVYYHARYRLERFGPLAAWRFCRQHTEWNEASPDLRADWLSLQGMVAARLRDFDRADKFFAQAEALAPHRAWIFVERASVLEAAEKPAEALASARRALELQPWFRPGVQAVAHLLTRRGLDAEAAAGLEEGLAHLESGIVAAQLAVAQYDLNRFAAAAESLDKYEQYSPLAEPDAVTWLAGRRADVQYRLGRPGPAAAFARANGDAFYTQFADRLDATPAAAPTLLAVPAPAALTATVFDRLGAFWTRPFPAAPDPAPAAPSDGLPDPADRTRAEAAGWAVKEFTLSFPTAEALIAAGVPFLVALVEVGVAQYRLCHGTDAARQSVFLTDGPDRRAMEAPLAVVLEKYGSTGPRAIAFAPPGTALPAAAYPDAAGYDALYAVQKQIAAKRFAEAKAALADVPPGEFAERAALAWARATAHPVLLHRAAGALLALHPHDGTYVLARAAAQRELGRTAERRAFLEAEGRRPDADALVQQSLAQVLLADPTAQDDADMLLRRSVRARPHAAAGYYLLATQAWERQRFDDAVELYRMAACLDDREDQFADAYARVTKATGHAPDALRLFQQKATRAATPQPTAVKALFQALLDRDEPEQAFAMVAKAVEKLAGGPAGVLAELQLFRAEVLAQFGRADAAAAELAAAKATAPAGAWRKAAAKVARLKPDPVLALEHLTAALLLEPAWADGHRLAVGLTAETAGKAAAKRHAAAAAQQRPFHYPLARLKAELYGPDADDAAVQAAKDLLVLCPEDAWAERQLALVFADRGRDADARAAAARAGKLEPDHPSHFAVVGHVHRRGERTTDALEAYRDAVRADVDNELAVAQLVQLSRGRKEKRAALRLIAGELRRQPHAGDGLVAYRDAFLGFAADGDDEAPELFEELLAELEGFLDDRPDLWQAWSVVVQQLGLLHRLDEARTLAKDATARFPLLAQLWADLGRVAAASGQPEDRVEAMRGAVAAAPGWAPAARELAEALAETGEDDEAVAVLERAAARNPLDAAVQATLADQLWQAGRSEEALDHAKRAARLDPGFDPVWSMVAHWGERLDRPEEAPDLARELTAARPGDPRGWLKFARLAQEEADTPEVIAALNEVIRLDPTNVEAHDLKAERLAETGKYDDALAAAKPPHLAADLPLVLQGRAAWIEAKRGNFAAAIPPMQALVSVEPNYYWGWQQLAEWYSETGRNQGFLEAAGELVRLKPEHPIPLTMRGEAKLKTNDRDGGKGDLRDALRVAPQYAPAAAVLFDACLADGELRDARAALAVLQEHMSGPEVLVKQTQFYARTGDADGAVRAVQELAELPGEGPPLFLQLAFAELEQNGMATRGAEALKAAWSSGQPFNPWAAVYWIDTDAGQSAPAEERLAATDAAIRQYPKFAAGYDRKAELLALAGRHDEAAAACKTTAAGDPPPLTLRGRLAWVEARRGNRAKAISLMRSVVIDDPQYLWGWRNLSQWYDAENRHKECLDAAEHMVELSPTDPLAYGYRGEAKRVLGDRAGAKADFARAFELDPAFDAAGLHLINELLHAGDVDEAANVLAVLQEHAAGPMVKLRAVQVAVRQEDLGRARLKLRALVTDPDAPKTVLADAATAFAAAGHAAEADDELKAVATGPTATPAAVAVWAERCIADGRGAEVLEELPRLLAADPPAGREAVLAYAAGAVAAGRADQAAVTVHRFSDALRGDAVGWARAGAVLADGKNYALAAAWLSDWADRDDVTAATLLPLADSLRGLDRDGDALAVAAAGVGRGGSPTALAAFRGWLALDAALHGRTEDAAKLLAGIDRPGLPDAVRLVLAMGDSLVMVQQAGPDGKRAAFADAKDHLKTAAGACKVAEVPPGTGRWYKRVVGRLAADAGGVTATAWAAWQRVRPWVR